MKFCVLVFVFWFCILSFFAHGAEGQGPFSHRIQNPLYLQLVSFNPERAKVLPPRQISLELTQGYSSVFERVAFPNFDYISDMELWRVALVPKVGLGNHWEAGLEIPWMHIWGGFLDPFVSDFHNLFGFNNGGRQTVANNGVNFHVIANGVTAYQFNSEGWNLGEISFFAKHLLLEEEETRPAVATRFVFKFPTGDRGEGFGSGNPGFGIGIAMEKHWDRWGAYLNGNYLVDGSNDLLDGLEYLPAFEWMGAGEFALSKHWSALMQLVGSTPRLKGYGYNPWTWAPLDLILGFRGEYRPWSWQVGFSEDVLSRGPSIDFTGWITVAYRFGH